MGKSLVSPMNEYTQDVSPQNGTSATCDDEDHRDMERLGLKQQFNRTFSFFPIITLNIVVGGTWYTWLTSLPFVFLNGGRGGAVWIYLISWICSVATVLSLAEMASIAPVAGGQYHWVSIFAPPRVQKPLSYICGWLTALGWQSFVASSAYATGNIILILASIQHPAYEPTAWQETLITLLVAIIAGLLNIFGVKFLPAFERWMFLFFLGGWFAVLVPLLVLGPKVSSKDVWTGFGSFGGWANLRLACAIGQITSGGAMIGADVAVHMAEEVRDASLVVPRAMVGTVILGPAMGFAICIAVDYCIQSLTQQVVDSTAVYPFISIFQHAVGSEAGAIGMTAAIVLLSFAAAVNSIAAASRSTWAFARDGGLPMSSWWVRVGKIGQTPVPVLATLLANWLTVFAALLNVAGSEVYDAIISLAIGAVCSTYVISIGARIHHRLCGKDLVPRKFSLRRAGLYINIVAFFYNIQLVVFSYFPVMLPVTAINMNYGSVVFVGVVVLAGVSYAFLSRSYTPPVVHSSEL